ncbi:TRC40/GET3/ArsA family transport-energizing ATPase [Thermodesulfobacteriota bacterium]
MRIIFFAGKGGVGKTSVAAATGIKVAELGHKTVIISLDVAHSLSDIFDLDRGLHDRNRGVPVEVNKNLWIQELDIQEEIEGNWGDIYKYISALFNTTGLDEILAEELSILPGMEEVSLLLYINKYVQEKHFDVIILDCAPTGESLRFISIPTTLEWYIKKIFKMEKAVAKFVGPIAKRIYDVPIPGDEYFNAIAELFGRLQGVDKILTDPQITTVRLVTNPEKIVLKETQRAFMYFCLFKMSVDSIIMNRILPSGVNDKYFKAWKESQRQYLESAEEYFSPIPVFKINLSKGEIFGYDQLKSLADQLYEKKNPLKHFYKGEPYNIIKKDGQYQLIIKLPFIVREDVELNRISDELIIRIGGFKRNILLPRQVAATSSVKARYEGEHLRIYFKGDNHGKRED